MKTIWKAVPEYEGYYEASNTGLIRSVERTLTQKNKSGGLRQVTYKSRVLRPYKRTYKRSNIKNRYQVVLSKHGKTKSVDVHKIVALTFIDNPEKCDTVNHINGDPSDNRINNLEWMSKADNNRHAFKNNLVKTQKLIAKIHPETKEILKVYPGESEACRQHGALQGKIIRAMKNNYKFRGCYWKYVNKDDEGVTTIEPWLGITK